MRFVARSRGWKAGEPDRRVVVLLALMLVGPTYVQAGASRQVGQPGSLPEEVPAAFERWAFAAAECPAACAPPTRHRDVAGVLGALPEGGAAILFLDPPGFQTQTVEQFKALHVTFAARNARLDLVARLLNDWLRKRVRFSPRAPEERIHLELRGARLEELVAALAASGEALVMPPPQRKRSSSY